MLADIETSPSPLLRAELLSSDLTAGRPRGIY
jgi:hypothetical protein